MNEKGPVIKLGDHWYLLLRQFTGGATAIVWQAQQLEQGVQPNTDQHQIKDHIFLMSKGASDYSNFKQDDRPLLALKLAKRDHVDDLRKEASNLTQISKYGRHAQWMVQLREDRSHDTYAPCLILSWASGQQLDNLEAPLTEREGVTIAYQLLQLIQAVYTLHSKVLTDSIKANSVFWDSAAGKITIIDLGLVGIADDLERLALPLLGETLYRALVGSASVGEINSQRSYEPRAQNLGAKKDETTWAALSFQTRVLLSRLVLGDYQPQTENRREERNQMLTELQQAFKNQRDLWETPDDLLQLARRASDAAAALNAYDIARQRGQSLQPYDEKHYQQYLRQILDGLLSSLEPTRLIPELGWMSLRDPQNPLIRRAVRVIKTMLDASSHTTPGEWPEIVVGLKQMSEADTQANAEKWQPAAETYRQAVAFISEQSPWQLEILQLEAHILAKMAEAAHLSGQRPLTPQQFEDWEKFLTATETLINEWESKETSDPGLAFCKGILKLRRKSFHQFSDELLAKLKQNVVSAISSARWDDAAKYAEALEKIYAAPELPTWKKQIRVNQILLALEKTIDREQREGLLYELEQAASGLGNSDLREQIAGQLARHAAGYALLDRYTDALAWLARLRDLQPDPSILIKIGEPEGDLWVSRKTTYEIKVAQREWEGAKALDPLRQLIEGKFCFDPAGESLHILLIDRLLQLGEFDEAATICRQADEALKERLDRQGAWLASEERQRIERFHNSLPEWEKEIPERRQMVQAAVFRAEAQKLWENSEYRARTDNLLTLHVLLSNIKQKKPAQADDSLPQAEQVKATLLSLVDSESAEEPQQALATLGALRILYPNDADIGQKFEDLRDKAVQVAYASNETIKNEIIKALNERITELPVPENGELKEILRSIQELKNIIQNWKPAADADQTNQEVEHRYGDVASSPTPDEKVTTPVEQRQVELFSPNPTIKMVYESACRPDSGGLGTAITQILSQEVSETEMQQAQQPVNVLELAQACLDEREAAQKPMAATTSSDENPTEALVQKLKQFASCVALLPQDKRVEKLSELNEALITTGTSYALSQLRENPRLVEEAQWQTLEHFRHLIARPQHGVSLSLWLELVEAAYKLWTGYQYQKKTAEKRTFRKDSFQVGKLLLTDSERPEWIVLEDTVAKARCTDWIYRSLLRINSQNVHRRQHWLAKEEYLEWREALRVLIDSKTSAESVNGEQDQVIESTLEIPEDAHRS